METQTDLRAVDSALKRHEAVSVEVNAGVSYETLVVYHIHNSDLLFGNNYDAII